jgi:hypothetical protein
MHALPSLTLRRASERGHADHGWLDSRHTFSFADYFDPEHMGFRTLRVINEDRVQPGRGFPTHGHRDMEIISYVLEGAIAHKDSLGHAEVLRPGEVQRMSAGTGVLHSEFNPSREERLHFYQVWILPDRAGHEPEYEQKAFPLEERQDRLALLVSPDGAQGSLRIHQDARMLGALLDRGKTVAHELAPGRAAWLQVARGVLLVNGERLAAGDGAALEGAGPLALEALEPAELLLFDLA